MKRLFLPVMIILFVVGLFPGPDQASSATAPSRKPAAAPAPETVPEWQKKWDALVAAAKKEGKVTVYVGESPPEVRAEVTKAFKDKYGITVDFLAGRAAEVTARLQAEKTAGLHVADAIILGDTNWFGDVRPMKITAPLDPLLILPEVRDPTKWRSGKVPMMDETHQALAIATIASQYYTVNQEMVKEGDLTTVTDLLKPAWKGKIVINDPSISGNGSAWFTFVVVKALGEEKGAQFMRDLVKQEPIISRDNRQMIEWVARGKYPIAVGATAGISISFIKQGAPIRMVRVRDGIVLTTGIGIVMATNYAPHPAAAQLFINWLASKEGGTVWSQSYGYPSTRLDVPTKGFLPEIIPLATDIYPDEAYVIKKVETRKLAKEIFGSLIK